MQMRCVPLVLAIAACLPAGEAPVTALGAGDVELLDERAWVESVSRRRQDVASAPAPVEVILVEDLLLSPASSVPDRLRYVAGVDVYQLRHGQYEVGLRGYNGPLNTRVMVLQDGWEFRLPELGTPIWSGTIDYSDLERVEVAKGPGSVTYGANAFGGVISMTSKPVPQAVRFTVVGRVGEPGAYEGDATLAGPIGGGFYGKLGAGYTLLDDLPGVDSGLEYQYSPRNDEDTVHDTRSWRARALLGAELGGDWRIEAAARTVRRDPWEVVDGAAQGPPTINIDDDLLTLELRSPWLRVSLSERRVDSDYRNLQASYDVNTDFSYLQFRFEDVERKARAQVDLHLGAHQLGFGGEVMEWESSSNLWRYGASYEDESTWETVRRTGIGLFAEDQWRLTDDLQVTAGVRGDNDSRTGNQTSPRVAINWTPAPRQYALLSYSRGYRLPNPMESYEEDYFVKPSEDLQSEQIQAVEAQWRLRDGRAFELSLGGFWNRADDTIWRVPLPFDEQLANFTDWVMAGTPNTIGPGPFFQFDNLDNPYTVLGAEASLRAALGDSGLTGWSNVTWQHGRYRDEVSFSSPGFNAGPPLGTIYQYDYTVPRDANAPPDWKVNLGVDWTEDGWFATAAGRYVDGRTVYDIGHTRLFRNTLIALQELDPYAALDLSVGYRFAMTGARFIRFSVMDVFDSSHVEYYQPTAGSLVIANETQYTSEVGRQIMLAVGWDW
jgi:outer membrane receptor protein involved in Fe transport